MSSKVETVEEEKKELSEEEILKQKRIAEQKKEDEDAQNNEIKYGIRYKLIALFSLLILTIAMGITYVATKNETASLQTEKKKQGEIIVTGLINAIKESFVNLYLDNENKIKKLKITEDYAKFYKNKEVNEKLFEAIDSQLKQPDVVYAYILGKNGIVLAHSNPDVPLYSVYTFDKGVKSYFKSYTDKKLKEIEPIVAKIFFKNKKKSSQKKGTSALKKNVKDEFKNQKEKIEVLDFADILSIKKKIISDAIGEVHIGISLESVNKQIFLNTVDLQLLGLIAITFGVLVAIIFATFIANPIRRIIDGMQQVTKGDFSASVLVKAKDEVGLMSRTFNIMLKGMSVLVSPEVARVVLQGGDLVNSGEKKVVTVLFSDIRGFTTLSESLTPDGVVKMLNGYMEIMTDIIIKYGGVVDKFVGDEIFAVYGAPFDHPMHPLAACATGIEMGVELDLHNKERIANELLPINIGIGINTGDVISGAMGSSKRIDYTSIGDAVNLGARLEGTNKIYGTLIIMSEFTYAIVKDDVIVRELDFIKVKGKNLPVQIFEGIALTESGQAKIDKFLETKDAKVLG